MIAAIRKRMECGLPTGKFVLESDALRIREMQELHGKMELLHLGGYHRTDI